MSMCVGDIFFVSLLLLFTISIAAFGAFIVNK